MDDLHAKKTGKKMTALLIALVFLFCIDRLVKNIMWFSAPQSSINFLHPVLNFDLAFSVRASFFSQNLITLVILGICLALGVYAVVLYRRHETNFFWWGLIVIGAFSNLMDRVTLGGVLDYFDLHFFPIFNLSDSYITVGVTALLLVEFIIYRTQRHRHGQTILKTN